MYVGTFYDCSNNGIVNVIDESHYTCACKLYDRLTERYDAHRADILEDLENEDFVNKYDCGMLLYMLAITEV